MSKHDLWVERWRPQTLDDYVWSSTNQKEQVESWLKEGRLPSLLMTGPPGTGKCLGPNERIKVRINLDTLPDHIKARLKQYL